MPPRGSFERRLVLALLLFSLIPSLLLIGAGTYLLSEVVALRTSAATFERLAESGRTLLELADRSGDPALARAAAAHREELSSSLVQSGRWAYLNERAMRVIPVASVVLAAMLIWLALRAARGIARELARPIGELSGWAQRVAREEPLPPPRPGEADRPEEFAALRRAFRGMAADLAASRARALEAERTRTWITMARSVAHELKNSLTPLRLAVGTLQRRVEPEGPSGEALEVLGAEAVRLEELARAFSQFGRLPQGPPSEIDLPEQIEYLLRTRLPERVAYEVRAPADLPRIVGHHEVLGRAFTNIILNAVEALGEEGGALEVDLTAVDGGVEVRFRDTGAGIQGADPEQVWEPDFTTKPRGTGLGLALVRQAVAAHGGRAWAANAADGGAEFRIHLPAEGATATPQTEEAVPTWLPS